MHGLFLINLKPYNHLQNTGCPPPNLTAFCRPIILAILVEITSNFHKMNWNRLRFYISWNRTLCAYLNGNLPERWIGHEDSFLKKWTLRSPDLSLCDSFYGYMWSEWYSLFQIKLMKSSWESLLHWIKLPETCYSVFGKSLTIDLTYAMSQAVHVLNTYEICPRINVWSSILKLFDFVELYWVVFKIIAFKMISHLWGDSAFVFGRKTWYQITVCKKQNNTKNKALKKKTKLKSQYEHTMNTFP